MKIVVKSLAIALSCCSASAFAAAMAPQTAATPSNQQLAQEVAQLKQEVAQLQAHQTAASQAPTQEFLARKPAPSRQPLSVNPVVNNQHSVFGTYVVTGPSVGVPTHYNGSSLIVNSPSINTDYKLLQRTQAENNAWTARGFKTAYPHVTLSGNLEAQAIYAQPYNGSYSSDIDLTAAELDTNINVTPWVSGFMSYVYDNHASNSVTDSARVNNSHLFIDKAFITIGNLNKAPVYGSIGQMFVPFGRYSHVTIGDPLTEELAKTKVRSAVVGYHMNAADAPYVEAYLFRGETSYHSNGTLRASQYGADGGFTFASGDFNGDAGLGYISTIADSQGMLDNGESSGFTGFDNSSANILQTPIPGVDAHVQGGMGPVTVFGEYVTAIRSFSKQDMMYDNSGAKPSAANVEGDYAFSISGHPVTFALSYNVTGQALALNLPKNRYMAALQMAIFRDTLLTFGYHYDEYYGRGKTATGGDTSMSDDVTNALGQHSNTVAAQLDVYF